MANKTLQDGTPWSAIYGDLNRRHAEEVQGLVVATLVAHVADRMAHGKGATDRTLTYGVRHCLDRKLVTPAALDLARKVLVDRHDEPSADVWRRHAIDFYLSVVRDEAAVGA
jgi:hypothetical protein